MVESRGGWDRSVTESVSVVVLIAVDGVVADADALVVDGSRERGISSKRASTGEEVVVVGMVGLEVVLVGLLELVLEVVVSGVVVGNGGGFSELLSPWFAASEAFGAKVGRSILILVLSSTSLAFALTALLVAGALGLALLEALPEDPLSSSSSSKSASKSASKLEEGVVARPPAPPAAAPPRFPARTLFKRPGPATRITWAIMRLTIESIS